MRIRFHLLSAVSIAASLLLGVLVVGWHLLPRPVLMPVDEWSAAKLTWSRGLLIALASTGIILAVDHWNHVRRAVVSFFTTPGSPIDLAVMRIGVATLWLQQARNYNFMQFAQLPDSMIVPPLYCGWIYELGLIRTDLTQFMKWVFYPAMVLTLLGLFTRVTTVMAAISAFYLMALTHFDGKVDHPNHILVWLIGLLATAPCGDAWSLDALRRRQPRPADAVVYALPIQFCWLFIGLIYFFPGFWKLWNSGLEWALSDHLKLTLHHYWWMKRDSLVKLRVDQYPLLLMLAGLGTLVFEIGFLFCVFNRRLHALLIVAGQTFHLSIRYLLGISFFSLRAIYLVLIPWSRLLRLPPGQGPIRPLRWGLWPTAALGTSLVLGNLWAGFRYEKEAYPISCFPTFDRRQQSLTTTELEIVQVSESGQRTSIDIRTRLRVGEIGSRRFQQRILQDADPQRRRRHIQDLQTALRLSDARLELYEVISNVDPDNTTPAVRRRILD